MEKIQEKKQNKEGLNTVFSLLPELEEGLTRISYTGERPVFQLFTAYEALDGGCVWIDVENHSSTYALADVAGKEALEKVSIGRAFTPFQHHQLCTSIEDFIDEDTELIAMPAINGLYEDGQISTEEAEELMEEALKHVKEVAEEEGLKVIVSDSNKVKGELEYLTGVYSQDFVSVNETSQGLRFSGKEFQTLIYPENGILQTTIPLWMKKSGGEEHGEDKRYVQATPR